MILPGANPWVRADLAVFSRYLRLPAPTLRLLRRGDVAPARPDAAGTYWAQEGTAEWRGPPPTRWSPASAR